MAGDSTLGANEDLSYMYKIVAASLLAAACLATPATADGGIKIGTLSCRVEGGAGFLIGSAKGVDCMFNPTGDRPSERYTGSIGKLGLDIGVTNNTVLGWIVIAPGRTKPGALKGSYTGIGAEATVGVGVGANALVGGFRQSINLWPVSVQAQTGLNASLAVTSLTLRYDR
jgi:Protein of unknown function (DUF992)